MLRLVALLGGLCVALAGKTAFLIIDVQNCFLPGGSLAVTNGNAVVPIINDLRAKYDGRLWDVVVRSQDWHCKHHISFASTNGVKQYSTKTLKYTAEKRLCADGVVEHKCSGWSGGGCSLVVNCTNKNIKWTVEQMMWPDHCIMHTASANFSSSLTVKDTDYIQRKGWRCHVDAYSAFASVQQMYVLELAAYLKSQGVTRIFVAGLASDFCVKFTSIDGAADGFQTYMIKDASRGVSTDLTSAYGELATAGVSVIQTTDLDGIMAADSSVSSMRGWSNGWWPTVIAVCTVLLIIACVWFCCVCFIRKPNKDDAVVVKMDPDGGEATDACV